MTAGLLTAGLLTAGLLAPRLLAVRGLAAGLPLALLLALGRLPGPLLHRFRRADEFPGPLRELGGRIVRVRTEGPGGRLDLLGELLHQLGDLRLELLGLLGPRGGDQALGEVDPVGQLAVADRRGRLPESPLGPGILRLFGQPVQLPFEIPEFLDQLVLPVEDGGQRLGPAGEPGRHLAHRLLDLALLLERALRIRDGVLGVPSEPVRLVALQEPARLLERLLRRARLSHPVLVPGGGGAAHRVGGFLEFAGRLGQLGGGVLPREPLQLAGELLGLLGEPALALAAGAGRPGREPFGDALEALLLLLLPPGELLQAFERRIELLVHLLALAPLQLLVLVAEPVHLQVEEVGEVLPDLGAARSAPSASLVLLLGELDLAEDGLGPEEVLEGALLRRERPLCVVLLELGERGLHLRRRERQFLGDLPHLFRRPPEAALELREEGPDLLHQPPLRERDRGDVLFHELGGDLAPVAPDVEGGRHDLPLAFGELSRHRIAAAPSSATPAPAALVGLAEVLGEGPDLDEEEIGARLPLLGRRSVVERPDVIGDEVSRLEVIVLEEEGVAGRHIAQPRLRSGEERYRLLAAAVDREDQLQGGDRVVVGGLRLDVHLFHRGHADVPRRPLDRDDRG